jgi:hypothetical protein
MILHRSTSIKDAFVHVNYYSDAGYSDKIKEINYYANTVYSNRRFFFIDNHSYYKEITVEITKSLSGTIFGQSTDTLPSFNYYDRDVQQQNEKITASIVSTKCLENVLAESFKTYNFTSGYFSFSEGFEIPVILDSSNIIIEGELSASNSNLGHCRITCNSSKVIFDGFLNSNCNAYYRDDELLSGVKILRFAYQTSFIIRRIRVTKFVDIDRIKVASAAVSGETAISDKICYVKYGTAQPDYAALASYGTGKIFYRYDTVTINGSQVREVHQLINNPLNSGNYFYSNADGIRVLRKIIGTTAERNNITSLDGLQNKVEFTGAKFYDTDLKRWVYWNGTNWTNADGTPLTEYTITQPSDTNVTNSNSATSIEVNKPYIATLGAETGYTLDVSSVQVTMGGVDITSFVFNSTTGVIYIASVTGNIVITATATQNL